MLIWLRSFFKAAQSPLVDYMILMQFKLAEKLALEKALDPPVRLKHVCLEIFSKPLSWIRVPPLFPHTTSVMGKRTKQPKK